MVGLFQISSCRPFRTNPSPSSVTLYDAGGAVVATSNPTDQLNASFALSLSVGQYYIGIEGVGKGTLATGYSDYGSLGYYSINGVVPAGVFERGFDFGTSSSPLWRAIFSLRSSILIRTS